MIVSAEQCEPRRTEYLLSDFFLFYKKADDDIFYVHSLKCY